MISFDDFSTNIDNALISINHWLSPMGCLLSAAFFLSLLFILKIVFPEKENSSELNELTAIAGEDVLTAQLDLARAFLEMGNNAEAHVILDKIKNQGTDEQRQSALGLLQKNL